MIKKKKSLPPLLCLLLICLTVSIHIHIRSSICQHGSENMVSWDTDFYEDTMTFMDAGMVYMRRRQWHPTPVLLPGKSHGRRSLVGCSLWGR